jgi:hypothetical protein
VTLYAKVAQGGQLGDGGDQILDDGGLGDFQFEVLRFKAGFFQYAADGFEHVAAGKLPAGDIHTHAQPGEVGQIHLPLFQLPARLVHRPLPQCEDQPRLFGDGNKIRGVNDSPLGMLPAKQCFHFDDLSGFEVQNGLVGKAQFRASDGVAQLIFDPEPLHGRRVHVGMKDPKVPAPAVFGDVERSVGVAENLLASLIAGVADGNAKARRRADLLAVDQVGLGKGILDALADGIGIFRSTDGIQQHDKLIPPEPSQMIGLHPVHGVDAARGTVAGGGAQPVGDGNQQLVTGLVTEAVVDDLEPVQVEKDDGKQGAAAGALNALADALHQQRAVGQTGEGIVQRDVPHLFLGPFSLGDGAVCDALRVDEPCNNEQQRADKPRDRRANEAGLPRARCEPAAIGNEQNMDVPTAESFNALQRENRQIFIRTLSDGPLCRIAEERLDDPFQLGDGDRWLFATAVERF